MLFRVLMCREQVLKVVCNHLITTSMKLKPMASCQSIWCWVASDYADNYPRVEQFAVQFQVRQRRCFVDSALFAVYLKKQTKNVVASVVWL